MTATSRSLSFTLKSATVRSSSGRFLRELLANERLPQDELQARQDHAARAIAEHAMQESPFYRRLYGERGIDPRILDLYRDGVTIDAERAASVESQLRSLLFE